MTLVHKAKKQSGEQFLKVHEAAQKKLTRVEAVVDDLEHWPDGMLSANGTIARLRKALAEPSVPRCAVAGIPATDPDACGDCEPCLTPKAMIARAEALSRSQAAPSEQAACICKHQHVSIHHFCTDCRTHIAASENPAYRPPVAPPVPSATRERLEQARCEMEAQPQIGEPTVESQALWQVARAIYAAADAIIEAVGGDRYET